MKRVLIVDLDNTIYPVSSIADHLFGKLFKLIDENLGEDDRQVANNAKLELTRRPYQHVADDFNFSDELKAKGIEVLGSCEMEIPMYPYEQYNDLQDIKLDKFLVTTGFTKLQMSKVKMLNIENHFKSIYVVDPEQSTQTKGDVFKMIMQENGYAINEVLVIGDDPQSEIKFAKELGIDTFLFDPEDKYINEGVTYHARDYSNLLDIINQ
jgi:putative hydrolase of the HAD superfamily